MSINPIELLKQKVTSTILNDQDTLMSEKSSVLSKFYPILLSLFAAKPDLITKLKNTVSPSLNDLFANDDAIKHSVLSQLSGSVPSAEIENTLNSAIQPSLQVLSEVAGNDQQSILNYLRQHAESIRSYLPAWATTLLAPLGIGAGLSSLGSSASAVASAQQKTGKFRGLIPIIALILLGLLIAWLWRSCQHQSTTAVPTTDSDTAASMVTENRSLPATLKLKTDATGAVNDCQAGIANKNLLAMLQTQVKQTLGFTKDCTVDLSQNYAGEFRDKDALAGVLGALNGIPNASLEWVGDTITLNAADAASLDALTAKIKTLVPNTQVVSASTGEHMKTKAETTVSQSLNAADAAIAAIDPNNVDIYGLANALNLQIINFASGSNVIPEENKAILNKAAKLLNKASGVKLNVGGHTDSTGNASANKALSQRRAQAVVNYFVSQGVDASKLVAQGHGSDHPVADNATEDGRFKNRRIEFSVAK